MSRSRLAYPLNRGADADAGGAADLQTDIMRFMAILSMCLLAIFALVQSIPLAPVEQPPPPETTQFATAETAEETAQQPVAKKVESPPSQAAVVLTRPQWVPKFAPTTQSAVRETPPAVAEQAETSQTPPSAEPAPVAEPSQQDGFTLRFASDAALMRAVAGQHLGLYAIENGRARRMTVGESRISFWDASTPNAFHEMETGTVPLTVIEALGRSGADATGVSWGVTLPGKLKTQLDTLLHAHRGGSLIIGADGNMHWEAS